MTQVNLKKEIMNIFNVEITFHFNACQCRGFAQRGLLDGDRDSVCFALLTQKRKRIAAPSSRLDYPSRVDCATVLTLFNLFIFADDPKSRSHLEFEAGNVERYGQDL